MHSTEVLIFQHNQLKETHSTGPENYPIPRHPPRQEDAVGDQHMWSVMMRSCHIHVGPLDLCHLVLFVGPFFFVFSVLFGCFPGALRYPLTGAIQIKAQRH